MRNVTLTLDGPMAVGKSRLLQTISYALEKTYPGKFTFVGEVVDIQPFAVNTVEPMTITVVEMTDGRAYNKAAPLLMSAEQAREITAGISTEELLMEISKAVGAAARQGLSRALVSKEIVRGVRDWNGDGDDTVIGRAAKRARAAGYTVKKGMDADLVIEWKTQVAPTGSYLDR
jgi:energy-coupling factor transporter ATP-binding protein EcfA2